MPTTQDIEKLLHWRFKNAEVTVTDDSAKHAGHAAAPVGGGSHFSVRVVTDEFVGLNRVARHRAVYAALLSLFDEGLHALAIEAKAVGE